MIVIIYKIIEFALSSWTKIKSEKMSADTQRIVNNDNAKASVLMSGAFWFQLFFIVPLAFWFAGVVVYSLLWCQACVWPQPWTIAALPAPLNEWAGWIVGFLFLVYTGRK